MRQGLFVGKPATTFPLLAVAVGQNRAVSQTQPFTGTRAQHIARVAFLLRYVGQEPGAKAPDGAVAEMRSGQRLQAADFWMRNPDYLADVLLDEEAAGQRADGLVQAKAIFEDREPELRRLPMTKWRFGAYEGLDDVLGPLILYGLVCHEAVVRTDNTVAEHRYWLMPPGVAFCDALVAAEPETFTWYAERARLIATVVRDTPGSALKDQQYKRIEYASTRPLALIPPITEEVRARLRDLEEQAA